MEMSFEEGHGAIRIDKQDSPNISDSSNSGGALKIEQRLSQNFGVPSAFEAAEFKVRTSHIELLSEESSNIDLRHPLTEAVLEEKPETQGPPIIIPIIDQSEQILDGT